MDILIVINESPHVLMATCCLLNGLRRELRYNNLFITGIGQGLSALRDSVPWLCRDKATTFMEIDYLNVNDPYSLKISAFKRVSEDARDAVYFYIDYDHLAISPLPIYNMRNRIVVSSERSTDNSFGEHYNTSLIIGHRNTIHGLLPQWIKSYTELSRSYSYRHLEEISFTHATRSMSIKIDYADCQIQGNFSNMHIGSLFHYGGDAPAAKDIKKYLHIQWIENKKHLKAKYIDYIECEVFNKICASIRTIDTR